MATTALVLLGSALLLSIVVTHRRLLRALKRTLPDAPPLSRYPSVTVVRPIKGLDVGEEQNVAAALEVGARYPGEVETLFIFDDDHDPAFDVVLRAVEVHRALGRRGLARVLLAGAPPEGRTGKLNAMLLGQRQACRELIAFNDSDTRPGPDLLRCLVEKLVSTPRAGVAFAPVVVDAPMQTAGDVGYALLVNGWYGPAAAQAAKPGGDLFLMGQFMVFSRPALDAIGGVGCAEGQLVDDMYIGECVERAGYRNLLIRAPLSIATGGMRFGEFLRIFRRWLLFSRSGLPFGFLASNWLRGIELGGALACTVAALSLGDPLALPIPAFAVAASLYSQAALQRRFGGQPIPERLLWMTLALPLLSPFMVLSAILYPRVAWRGRTYSVGHHATLASHRAG